MRKDFPLLEKITYLDSAAGALKPIEVVEAINKFYLEYPMNPHSIDSKLGMLVYNLIGETRKLVADLVDATPEEVILTSGTTEGLNRAAQMLMPLIKKGDKILVSPYNHVSNLIPYMELAKRTGAELIYTNDFVNDINLSVKIVAVAQTNNTIDMHIDMHAIYAKAQTVGAIVINDAAQAITHEKVSLKNCDIISWSGTKLYGPTGTGALIVSGKLLEKLQPSTFGGGAVADVKNDSWIAKSDIHKFEPGTPNTAGIVGLGAAIKYFNKHKVEGFANMQNIAEYAYDELMKIDGIKMFSRRGDHNILFNIKDFSAQDVVSHLGHKDIILRAGEHCAKALKGHVSFFSSIRLSLAFYTNKNDIEIAVEAIKNGGDFLDFV